MTNVADPPPFSRSQPIVSADVCRRPPPLTQYDADATYCRHDPVQTRTVADAMWRTADEEVDQYRPVEVDPLKCRWSLTIAAVPHRRWMIFSDPQLNPAAYWLIWNKQDFLWTDFIDLSLNYPVHTYAISNQFIFFSSLFCVAVD